MNTNGYFAVPYRVLCAVGVLTLLLVLLPLFSSATHAQSTGTTMVYVATSTDVTGYPNPEDPGSTSTSVHFPWHVGPQCPACFITIQGSDIYTATSTVITRSNALTGKLESIIQTAAPIVAPLTFQGTFFYVATSQGIDAYGDANGRTYRWRWHWPGHWYPCQMCGITYNQGLIYARSDANEAVLDASSGNLLGAHTFSNTIIADPIFNGATPIIQTSSSVYGFSDPYFSGLNWQFDTPVVTCTSCSLFFTPRSHSVVATVGNTFDMLNASSGQLIASTALPAAPILSSVPVGNTLQVITAQGAASASFSGSADGDDDVPICGNGIPWWRWPWPWPGPGPVGNSAFGSAVSPVTGSTSSYIGSNTSLFVVDAASAKQLNTIQLSGAVQSIQTATF